MQETANAKNIELFIELSKRGFYVQKIGQDDNIQYIIVSSDEPAAISEKIVELDTSN